LQRLFAVAGLSIPAVPHRRFAAVEDFSERSAIDVVAGGAIARP
jgi:hypothetical protein